MKQGKRLESFRELLALHRVVKEAIFEQKNETHKREPIVGTSGGRLFPTQKQQGCKDPEAGVSFQYLKEQQKRSR